MLTAADLSAIVAACWAHPSGVSYLAKIQAIHDLAHCVCSPVKTGGAARYPALLPVTVPIDKRRRQSKAMALLLATRNL